MILIKVKVGENPGEPTVVQPSEFAKKFTKTIGSKQFVINQEACQWVKEGEGRIGSHFQIDQDLYIKILDENDDYRNYYAPPKNGLKVSSKSWCAGSCDCDGNCGSGCKC